VGFHPAAYAVTGHHLFQLDAEGRLCEPQPDGEIEPGPHYRLKGGDEAGQDAGDRWHVMRRLRATQQAAPACSQRPQRFDHLQGLGPPGVKSVLT
jgi:hypothetical protein